MKGKSKMEKNIGKVIQIIGPVLDIRFESGKLPDLLGAIEIEHEGDDLTISFNNKYLIDAIRSCECDRLRIEMSTAISSINIIPLDLEEGSDELFFLLPIKTMR